MTGFPRMSISAKIVEDIKQRILNKEYLPGSRLPTERALAEHYQVSRIPVREALKTLEQMGIVATHHGRGSFIREADAKPVMDRLSQQLYLGTPSVLELLKVRKLLEKQAAKDAAMLRTEAELEQIRRAETRCRMEIEKARLGVSHSFHAADFAFHEAIAEASHNELFKGFFTIIYNSFKLHQTMAISGDKATDKLRSLHAAIFEAIACQDPDSAGKAMEAHMDHVTEMVKMGQEKLADIMRHNEGAPASNSDPFRSQNEG